MKIAILSDIHANLPALSAVISEVRKIDVNHLFVLGDLIGYYYQPDKILDLLSQFPKIITY